MGTPSTRTVRKRNQWLEVEVTDPVGWYFLRIEYRKPVVGTDALPTPEELKAPPYVREGWLYDAKIWQGRPEDKFYDEDFLKERFVRYNRNVKGYFRFKDNMLTVDVAEDDAYQKLCSFLGRKPIYNEMPWENKTR